MVRLSCADTSIPTAILPKRSFSDSSEVDKQYRYMPRARTLAKDVRISAKLIDSDLQYCSLCARMGFLRDNIVMLYIYTLYKCNK